MMKFASTILFALLFSPLLLTAQKPVAYYTFDEAVLLKDVVGGNSLNQDMYACGLETTGSARGKGVKSDNDNCLLVSNFFRNGNGAKAFTIEFLFRGKQFLYLSFPVFNLKIGYQYAFCDFNTISGQAKDEWRIPLNGSGIGSYDYWADGNWHHAVFKADAATGTKEIWIDGQTIPAFKKDKLPRSDFVFDKSDGFKWVKGLDEVAFYNTALSGDMIRQHANEIKAGGHYTFTRNTRVPDRVAVEREAVIKNPNLSQSVDAKEFAPGYPNYSVQATEQLKTFALPRFPEKNPLNRNFPWLDISYLHRELPGNGGKGFGRLNPQRAVELVDEMANNWNYYIEVPCLRQDSASAAATYRDPSSLAGSLVRYANAHPELPLSTIILQAQNRPVHAGFDRNTPYVSAQDLPDNYYLRGSNGKPVMEQNRKWLSPLMPMDVIRKDALTAQFYLRQMTHALKRPIDIINENGEVFGHIRPESLLKSDPAVKAHMQRTGYSASLYSGWFLNKLDSTYRATILGYPALRNSSFTFYNVTAVNSVYWPDYSIRKNVNSAFNNINYSTPDFYPGTPRNWRLAAGSNNGYGALAEGRQKEIAMGVKLFSPFISAGWGKETDNVRPAQWLGLLKSMMMLGADFYYVGYFNVTGPKGWPDGAGPNDPRGYIYQVAMPVYAQETAARAFEFISKGTLLDPQKGKDRAYTFRLDGQKENQLIMARQLGKRYLIYGSVQPNSNLMGNGQIEESTSIRIGNQTIRFNIRRQGSVYVLDLSGASPVFYQLDGWHQYEHPYFWKQDFEIEAENPDNINTPGNNLIGTETGKNNYDFTGFTSYIRTSSIQDRLSYRFIPRKSGNLYGYVRARTNGAASTLPIQIGGGNNMRASVAVSGKEWKWYRVDLGGNKWQVQDGQRYSLEIRRTAANMEIDKILITNNSQIPL